jgi:hypothetical protein
MKTFLWCLCSFLCLAGYGQHRMPKPKIMYKKTIIFSPFALVDLDQTILPGGEYRFSQRWSVVADVGYTFSSYYITNNKNTSGFTVRPAIRRYYGRRNELFWQAQLLYKQVTYLQKDWLDKDCVEGVPTYSQYQEFRFLKKVYGINAMAGEVMPLSNKLYLEVFAGLGMRLKEHDVIGEGNSCYRTNTVGTLNMYRPRTTTISAPISLRLVYRLE